MGAAKTFKKGEFLFQEGEAVTNLQLIQSGKVTLIIPRDKGHIEVLNLGANNVLGEYAFANTKRHPFTALATVETKVIEVPMEALMTSLATWSQVQKLIVKGMSEKLKTLMNEVKSHKMEKNALPCGPDMIPRTFALFALFAILKCEEPPVVKKPGDPDPEPTPARLMQWRAFKQFGQKVFLESPLRLEQALFLLTKLGLAEYKMEKLDEDPDAPEEISTVTIFNPATIELFYEFYQHYYYKGASGREILKVNMTVQSILKVLLDLTEGAVLDRAGSAKVDYQTAVDTIERDYKVKLYPDNVGIMETKGLFIKRHVPDNGPSTISFDRREFAQMFVNWRILKEIDRWNAKGFVDLEEDNEPKKILEQKAAGEVACPSCGAGLPEGYKFCGECGHKLAA